MLPQKMPSVLNYQREPYSAIRTFLCPKTSLSGEGVDLFWQLDDDRFVGRLKPRLPAGSIPKPYRARKIVLEET